MAKAKIKYRTRAAKRVRRAAKGGFGSMKPVITGVAAGAAGAVATKYIGELGHPAACLGIGFLMKDNTLKTIGARELGAALAGRFVGNGGGTVGGTYN